jgi:hypothetical protein
VRITKLLLLPQLGHAAIRKRKLGVKLAGFTDAASKETQPEELDYLEGVYGSIGVIIKVTRTQ